MAVEIYPSASRLHFLNRLGPEEGVFVRVGSTNRRADMFLGEEMRRYNQVSSFDEQPRPELNSEAIDFRAASEFFKPIRKLTRRELQTLKIVTNYQGQIVPTIGGILLFGAYRLNHCLDAWIQAGQFAGNDRRSMLNSAEQEECRILRTSFSCSQISSNGRLVSSHCWRSFSIHRQ